MSVNPKTKYVVVRQFGGLSTVDEVLIRIAKARMQKGEDLINSGNSDTINNAKHPIIMPPELEAK